MLVADVPEADALYRDTMQETWEAIGQLRARGVADEFAAYLLPNAVAIRFTESADLLNLHHKFAMRLCYNAQEEIWRASLDEALQIREVNPRIGPWLLPPVHAAPPRPGPPRLPRRRPLLRRRRLEAGQAVHRGSRRPGIGSPAAASPWLVVSSAALAATAVPQWQQIFHTAADGTTSSAPLAARELADGTVLVVTQTFQTIHYNHDGTIVSAKQLNLNPRADAGRVRTVRTRVRNAKAADRWIRPNRDLPRRVAELQPDRFGDIET